MRHVTFADLIAGGVPLAASEAAALTLGVARVMDARRIAGECVTLPDDEWILLSSSGEVSIVEVHGVTDTDETARLSALLRRLLRLDARLPSRGQDVIPGGLLIVLARNLGYIHLPATGPDAFRAALERFATANPALLSGVFWRAASGRTSRPGAAAPRCPSDGRKRLERRAHGASRGDLRRALRDLERELFELRGRFRALAAPVRRPVRSIRRSAVAAGVAACVTGALAAAALAVTGTAPERAIARPADVALRSASVAVPAAARGLPGVTDGTPTPLDQPARPPAGTATPAPHTAAQNERQPAPNERQPAPIVQRVSVSTPREGSPRPATTRTERPRTTDPLAALRGGTRGIPFALPPG